jgi:sterol desaturase/sphingolipid hydroxylase (fatty acid hydroxylase superfamily)
VAAVCLLGLAVGCLVFRRHPYQLLPVAITVMATYGFSTLIQMVLHWFMGHRRWGGRFFRIHVTRHHGIYAGRRLATPSYEDEEISLTAYYLLPCLLACGVGYLLLPPLLFWVHLATFTVMFALHVYLHVQFHVRRSWLNRFSRFRTLRRLHNIHHRHHGRNFAVLEPFWDRVFGTYQAGFGRKGAMAH